MKKTKVRVTVLFPAFVFLLVSFIAFNACSLVGTMPSGTQGQTGTVAFAVKIPSGYKAVASVSNVSSRAVAAETTDLIVVVDGNDAATYKGQKVNDAFQVSIVGISLGEHEFSIQAGAMDSSTPSVFVPLTSAVVKLTIGPGINTPDAIGLVPVTSNGSLYITTNPALATDVTYSATSTQFFKVDNGSSELPQVMRVLQYSKSNNVLATSNGSLDFFGGDGHPLEFYRYLTDGTSATTALNDYYVTVPAQTEVWISVANAGADFSLRAAPGGYITYNLNGGSGTLPTDSTVYPIGANFVADSGGALYNDGYDFAGWTTNPNAYGPSETYAGSNAFPKGADLDLYAIWLPSGTYNYQYDDSRHLAITGFNGSLPSTTTIPAGVTHLNWNATHQGFESATTLSALNIPSSVTAIDPGFLAMCASLGTISVDATNSHFSVSGGVLFTDNGTKLLCYPAGISGTGYSVPAGTTSIADWAFRGAVLLTGIDIGANVTTVGEGAFDNCSALTAFTVSGSNNFFAVSSGVLYSKDGTTLVRAPQAGSYSSFTIPSTVITIGNRAFLGATSLTVLSLPDNVQVIGDLAFASCPLVSFTLNVFTSDLTSIGALAFTSSVLNTVNIPVNVTYISDGAFYNCTALVNVNMYPLTPPEYDGDVITEAFGPASYFFAQSAAVSTYNGDVIWGALSNFTIIGS